MSCKVIRLRPHHLLCIRFFTGHGYSQEFTRNMYAVLDSLSKGQRVKIVSGMDDLCAFCPNNHTDKNGRHICSAEEKVLSYDNKVLEILNPFLNKEINETWNTLYNLVSCYIMDASLFDSICASCQWESLCHKSNSKKNE